MASINEAVQALEAALPSQVTLPSHPTYTTHQTTPWSQICHTSPAAFIHLSNTSDVSIAFQIITKYQVKFAVRTTGHNPNEGFSNTDGSGVVLDLSGLNGLEILGEDEGTVVRVGAGCKWRDVYGFVEGRGRSVIGGRDGEVGVGGFLLGGGLGAFPNLYGLGTDNIKAIELVTADGSITQASHTQNLSLFTACKGGGPNFGIVTSFTLSTHPALHVTWSISLYNPNDYSVIQKATLIMQDAMEADKRIGCFTNFNQGFVAVGLLFAEDKKRVDEQGSQVKQVEAFGEFEGLDKIMAVADGETGGLGDLAKGMSHAAEVKKRYVGTVTTKPDQLFYTEVYKLWQDRLKDLPDGAVLHYTIQPVGSQAAKYGQEQGGTIMGLQAVPQVWWVFTAEWPSNVDDTAVKGAVDDMVEKSTALAKQKDLLLDFLCASFASGKLDVLGSYGSGSLAKMREVGRAWDGDGVFQGLQNGGFLLRNCK